MMYMDKGSGLIMTTTWQISFKGTIQQFPGVSGWHYVAVPKECTNDLNRQRRAWGMYPITA
jgi:hypothetical protein